jgi:type IV secretory pathway VirB6-like protein
MELGEEHMRIVLRIVAILLIAVGIVWVLQGINVLPGSFMTGHIQWAYRGALAAIVGVAILLFSRRGRKLG